jgi:predicted GNAT family acetyltransferase
VPRIASIADASLLFEWMVSFRDEAVPHDPPPERVNIERLAGSGGCLFWMANDRPVAVAATTRSLARSGAIAPVYTPPQHRGKGYAGSATAALADRMFAEGKELVSLYTNVRNEAANRCYARVGFEPYCDASFFLRLG